MTPVLTALTAKKAMQRRTSTKDAPTSDTGKILKPIIWTAAGALGLFLGYKAVQGIVKSIKKGGTEDRLTDNATSTAIKVRSACNPSGFDWSISMDGTDVPALMDALRGAENPKELAKAYKAMYNEPIADRIQKELTGSDLAEAMQILARDGGKVTPDAPELPEAGTIIVAKSDTRVWTKGSFADKRIAILKKGWCIPYEWKGGRTKKMSTSHIDCYELYARTASLKPVTVYVEISTSALVHKNELAKGKYNRYEIKDSDL